MQTKPTLRQQVAFKKTLKSIEEQKPLHIGKIMQESGYSKNTSVNPGKNLINKPGWQELLSTIDDNLLLDRLREIATDRKDKRASLTAIDTLLKLKDKFPANKTKTMTYNLEIDRLRDE